MLDRTEDGQKPQDLLRYSITTAEGLNREEVISTDASTAAVDALKQRVLHTLEGETHAMQKRALLLALSDILSGSELNLCAKSKNEDIS